MKNFILFFLLFVLTVNLYAQVVQTDSVLIKTKAAKADARHFKPTKAIRLAKRKRHLLNTSDYFMPTVADVSNPQFLKDSVYVQVYKDAAYKKSVNGSIGHIHYTPDLSTGHIVTVVVAVAAGVIVTILFLKAIFKNAI